MKNSQGHQSCQQRLLQALSLLLLLGCAQHAAGKPMQVTDADMGIFTYENIVQVGQQVLDVRVQLRYLCQQQDHGDSSSQKQRNATIHGYVAAFPLSNKPPAQSPSSPHYMPPANVQKQIDIQILSRNSANITTLQWLGPIDHGLWRVRANLNTSGPFQLHIAGASSVHDLPYPLCPEQRPAGEPDLAGGFFNVLTTTSDSSLRPSTLAFLVLEHNAYHRRLGFNGTILRANEIESEALISMPEVQEAVQSQGLIIWAWGQEHIATSSTHYFQKPKNQQTLLACYGRDVHLAFFDFDEYLVLPGGGTVRDARCLGKPLLDHAAGGSWVMIRFQAKSCPGDDGDFPCWDAGKTVSGDEDIALLHDVCPMSHAHGKHIMMADMVDTISVHFTWSEQFAGNVITNTTCGYLLHLYSLLEARRPVVTAMLRKLPQATWNVDPATGRREVRMPAGVAPLDWTTCQNSPSARMDVIHRWRKAQKGHGKGKARGKQQRQRHQSTAHGHHQQQHRQQHGSQVV